jgi:hypothetical protein
MGSWDNHKSTSGMSEYVQLKNPGEEFEGTIKEIRDHTFPAGTFNHQPEDVVVPRIIYVDEGQGERRQDLTQTVLRNAFIDLAPEPGTRVRSKNLGKPAGKSWIDFSVVVVQAGEARRPAAETADTDPFAGSSDETPAKSQEAAPPPF